MKYCSYLNAATTLCCIALIILFWKLTSDLIEWMIYYRQTFQWRNPFSLATRWVFLWVICVNQKSLRGTNVAHAKPDILLWEWHIRSNIHSEHLYFSVQNKQQQQMFKDIEARRETVWSRRGFKGRETVSQLCPAGTVSGCAPVMSAHEKTETGTKHSWVLAQSLGQGVMTGAGKMREDFKERSREWCFNTTKWGTRRKQQEMKRK